MGGGRKGSHNHGQKGVRRERLQMVALAFIVVGFVSMAFRFRELPNAARARESLSTMRGNAEAALANANAMNTVAAMKREASEPQVTMLTQAQQQYEQPKDEANAAATTDKPSETPKPTETPEPTLPPAQQRLICQRERDYGILDAIRKDARTFCKNNDAHTTQVTLYNVAGGIKTTILRNFELNMDDVKIHRPIKDLSQDGGGHDPRFIYSDKLVQCSCPELAEAVRESKHPFVLWDPSLALVNTTKDPLPTICEPSLVTLPSAEAADENSNNVVVFTDPVILISRRDDHNPFFQVSNALNAWIVAKSLNWDFNRIRVVHFDAGYPSPVDALHQKLLAPKHDIVTGASLMGKRVVFKSDAMLAPWEVSGPMMQHLNDREPCYNSEMMKDFRSLSLQLLGVAPTKQHIVDTIDENNPKRSSSTVVVTVITRRPYKGRTVQRVWRNEDQILDKLREEYADLNVVFQSVEFVDLTLDKQMQVIINSDVVIGMHGAGMVNVLWARPETLVIEIFPRLRKRWGYRNLCQFLGCDWHEFRGGTDIGQDEAANTKDKSIEYEEWRKFFDPLLRKRYAQVEAQQNPSV
ncbi:hypothetical protein FI667_g13491, partial [Globisporangium splendens]